MLKILVVDDEMAFNRSVCSFLNQNGFDSVPCYSAEMAYDLIFNGEMFDLIISDIMMPEVDGFEFAQNIRELNVEIPILFVTARDDFLSKQRGYKIGIDDYLVKPIDLNEMLLHINALLRRAKISSSKRIEVGNLVLDAEERCAYIDGEEIPLTTREFNITFKLLSYPKKAFTRAQLIDEFWDGDTESGFRTVDVYMTKLRKKFQNCTGFELLTVRGLGYKAVLR